MSLRCVLCNDKRPVPFAVNSKPLRHQLPSFVTRETISLVLIEIVNLRIHHSKQFFTEKIGKIDFFSLPQEGACIDCAPHGRSGRLKQQSLLDSGPDHAKYGTNLLFCI